MKPLNSKQDSIQDDQGQPLRVAVVGVCASGKSTLVASLRAAGYDARHVAQEHSYVLNMWQRIAKPDVLIFLDVDYGTVIERRPTLDLRPEHLAEQQRRLAHARENCNLYLDTRDLTPDEVRRQALSFLKAITN